MKRKMCTEQHHTMLEFHNSISIPLMDRNCRHKLIYGSKLFSQLQQCIRIKNCRKCSRADLHFSYCLSAQTAAPMSKNTRTTILIAPSFYLSSYSMHAKSHIPLLQWAANPNLLRNLDTTLSVAYGRLLSLASITIFIRMKFLKEICKYAAEYPSV